VTDRVTGKVTTRVATEATLKLLKVIVPQGYGQADSCWDFLQEKLFRTLHGYPYRKPTQVVKERILRCSSDPWLRN
jgi:hypothetical protein